MFPKKNPLLFIILFVLFMGLFVNSVKGSTTSLIEINDAESNIISALIAVQEAEKNGMDVKPYVEVLNNVLLMISDAKTAFKSGNLPKATETATTASYLSIQVEANVKSYTTIASTRVEHELQSSLILSSFAAAISVLLVYAAWRFFKRMYLIRIMEMRPEVLIDES